MILYGCSVRPGNVLLLPDNRRTSNSRSYNVKFSSIRPSRVAFTWTPPKCLAASTSLLSIRELGGLSHTLPILPKKRRLLPTPSASKETPTSFKYPAMTKKSAWWWRTLACFQYLRPVCETWIYAKTTYNLLPFFEHFEYFTISFLRAVDSLPKWFVMAYFFVAYLGVVKRKEWPHYLRFHVIMGMLLGNGLQVIAYVSRWLPNDLYWGKLGMHFWTFMAFDFLFTG